MTMPYLFLSLLCLLLACAPSAAVYTLTPLSNASALEYIGEFQGNIQKLGITLESGAVQRYQSQGDPLLEITQAFYQEYPGFCPLRVGAFQRSPTRARFLTITANQKDVRLFAYEPEQQGVVYAVLKGVSRDVLEVAPCPK